MTSLAINYQDIIIASQRIKGHAVVTPLLESALLNHRLGGRIVFKAENLQRTGSFKFRGAFNKLSKLAHLGQLNGVVAYSSGNHAQGVAAAAAHFGVSATIIMPADAPQIKITNTKALGAKVILYDRNKEDRHAIGSKLAQKHNLTLIPPYDDADIIAGQGTLGLEAFHQLQALGLAVNQVIGPIGGGGLMSGTSIALRNHLPKLDIWGAEPTGYDDAGRSLVAGQRLANALGPLSICDAIVTPMVGELTFPIMQRYLAGAKAVEDQHVLEAMGICLQELKVVVEPGGCVGLAAILAGSLDVKDKTTLVVLSGGNADSTMLSHALL
ncbi:MAG: threonine/serine dehydratase [Gammaproteobacteria bacterium]|nr:threonine/serine dehydratase [Gammaproteobacteria bacterium]